MATELDDELVPDISDVLDEVGTLATFRVITTPGTYTLPGSSVTGEIAAAHEWLIAPPYPYSLAMVDEDLIRSGDLQTTLAAQGITFTPVVGQLVTFDSATWTVVSVHTQRSGDLVCSFDLQLRKGVGS